MDRGIGAPSLSESDDSLSRGIRSAAVLDHQCPSARRVAIAAGGLVAGRRVCVIEADDDSDRVEVMFDRRTPRVRQ